VLKKQIMKEKNYYQNNQKKLIAKDEFLKDLKKRLKRNKNKRDTKRDDY